MDCLVKLTANFNLREFVVTNYDIPNVPTPLAVVNLYYGVTAVLQPLRSHLGAPIYVNSGFRCPGLNAKVGGVPNSQHLVGEAADIRCGDMVLFERLVRLVEQYIGILPIDQCLTGPGWMHISWKRDGSERRQLIKNFYE